MTLREKAGSNCEDDDTGGILQHIALSQAQPKTVIAELFKIAVRVRHCKNKIVLHLPSACMAKRLLQTLTERLYLPIPVKILSSS